MILDYGGVITKPQKADFEERIYKILGHEAQDFMKLCHQYRADYDNGNYTGEEYWTQILNQLGFPIDKSIFPVLIDEDIRSWIEINPNMFQLIAETRKKVSNRSIISNMPRDFLEPVKKQENLLAYFDETVFSSEVGLNKPNKRIYELCLENIGIPPNECLYVDDSKANIETARELGMQTIHFRTFTQFTDEFYSSIVHRTKMFSTKQS